MRKPAVLIVLVTLGALAWSAAALAAQSGAAAMPRSLWAVEVDAKSAKAMTPRRLASLRRSGINTLVADPRRIRGRALTQLRRKAARARLTLIVPRAVRKRPKGIVFARTGREAASFSRVGGVGLVVVRVGNPSAAAALRAAGARRVLALARLAPNPRSTPSPWRGAIRAARGSASLDLGVTPVNGKATELNAYLQLLSEPGALDGSPPSPPVLLAQNGASETTVSLVWGPSSDDVGVVGYEVSSDGVQVGAPTATRYSVGGLSCGRSYRVSVVAKDASGKRSAPALALASTAACPALPAPDLVPPTPPTNVRVNSTSRTAIGVAWNPSFDTVGVAGYELFRNGTSAGKTAATSFTFAGLTCGTGYLLQVEAYDYAGNHSLRSSTSSVTSACGAGTPPPPLPQLVAAYGFEEASGTQVADSSGNGNAGTTTGAARTAAGRFGRAVSFDGVNDWITVPDSGTLDLYDRMTIEAWVRPDTTGEWGTAVLKESADDLAYALYAGATNGRPRGQIRTTAHARATGPSVLPAGAWSHVATTWDGTTVRLYVNGSQVATAAASGTIAASTAPLRMGGNDHWDEWFDGTIDEVRVYSVARSAAQIATDMNTPVAGGGTPTPPPPPPPPPPRLRRRLRLRLRLRHRLRRRHPRLPRSR